MAMFRWVFDRMNTKRRCVYADGDDDQYILIQNLLQLPTIFHLWSMHEDLQYIYKVLSLTLLSVIYIFWVKNITATMSDEKQVGKIWILNEYLLLTTRIILHGTMKERMRTKSWTVNCWSPFRNARSTANDASTITISKH